MTRRPFAGGALRAFADILRDKAVHELESERNDLRRYQKHNLSEFRSAEKTAEQYRKAGMPFAADRATQRADYHRVKAACAEHDAEKVSEDLRKWEGLVR